jgi:lysozyme
MTQNQFDALVSLVFNIGARQFEESHLLVALNDRHYAAVAEEVSRDVAEKIAAVIPRRSAR